MAMRNAIRVAAAAIKKKGDVPCCAPQSVVDSSGLVIRLWCRECALPGVPFLAGILGIPGGLGIGVVSLVSLCSWAGFSYSSYSYAVALL